MKPPVTFSFLRPSHERVAAIWAFRPAPDGDGQIADWDVNTSIAFSVTARIDWHGVLEDCRIQKDARLALAVTWAASGTSVRGVAATLQLGQLISAEPEEFVLSGEIPGRDLGGVLDLALVLFLAAPPSHANVLSPKLVGSVLWMQSRKLVLEGLASRFPLEVRSFADDPQVPAGSAWFLEWYPDSPVDPLLGTVRLLLNESHPLIRSYLKNDGTEGERHALIGSLLKLDVARQLMSGMLRCADFVEGKVEMPEGSVGRHVRELLAFHFPGEEIRLLAQQLEQQPSLFEAKLQHAMNFLGSPDQRQ